MASIRTQVYLTDEQRRRLDERGRHEGRSFASLVREAIDSYLAATPNQTDALEHTFGALPDIETPSRDEWSRG